MLIVAEQREGKGGTQWKRDEGLLKRLLPTKLQEQK